MTDESFTNSFSSEELNNRIAGRQDGSVATADHDHQCEQSELISRKDSDSEHSGVTKEKYHAGR